MTTHERHFIPIWFWIGLLLFVYGVLIAGVGVYHLFVPMETPPAMAGLHIGVWWGFMLMALGGFYLLKFRPR